MCRKKIAIVILALSLFAVSCQTENRQNRFLEDLSANYWAVFDKENLIKFSNDKNSQIPQTAIYDIVVEHFQGENGKQKKALTLFFDGCRADVLLAMGKIKEGGVYKVAQDGGIYFSYAGGPADNPFMYQATSTSPGFAAILTGKWAKEINGNGVINNGYKKRGCTKIFINTVAELKEKKYSAAFNYLWLDHKTTYQKDIDFAREQGLNVDYKYIQKIDKNESSAQMDIKVKNSVIEQIKNGVDLVFAILEEPDNNGHSDEFYKDSIAYLKSVEQSDIYAAEIVDSIKNRATYEDEDWLILISTDHGGLKNGHGMQNARTRTTWISCNKNLKKFCKSRH